MAYYFRIFEFVRLALCISLILLTFLTFAQRKEIQGITKDSSQAPIIGAHVQNLTTRKGTISDARGTFKMPVQSGDIISISHLGYEQLDCVVDETWFNEDFVEFLLRPDTIYLGEIEVRVLPDYERFKQMILETEPEKKFEVYGYAEIDFKRLPPLTKEVPNELRIATIKFDMESWTKKGKEKKKFKKLMSQKKMIYVANQKFNRKWVREMTNLEGDLLTDFIAYCNFEPKYLAETPSYMIYEKMMALLTDFMEKQPDG